MKNKQETRTIQATEIRVATNADGAKTLAGYAVVFNSPSLDLGGFVEVCSEGMFTRTLRESPSVLMLRDHNASQLLGRTTAGTLVLTQDSKGLAFVVTLPNTAIAEDTYANVKAGNLDSCSFGFNVPDGGDKWTSTPDGAVLRTLLDVSLAEVSITSWAAYPATSVSLRSCPPSVRGLLSCENENGCECQCDECQADDCENCSNPDCQDADCEDCPNQDGEDVVDRQRSMRLELAKRK